MTDQNETQGTTPAEPAAPPERTMEEILRDPRVATAIEPVRDAVVEAKEFANEITLKIERTRIREVCQSFKRDGYTYLVDLTGVDYSKFPGYSGDRFAVVYHLYSFEKNDRVRLKVYAADGVKVPSVASVWKTANWPERETFDMFGVVFEDHPNLERILMWDEFNGHPLRKDFPVRGIDTGARIYPEVFPEGGGPKPGSTGKDAKDVNLWKGEWVDYGRSPVARPAEPEPPKKALPPKAPAAPKSGAAPAAAPAAPAGAAPAPGTVAQPPPAVGASGTGEDSAVGATESEAPSGASTDAPWHDESLMLSERMELAKGRSLKDQLFAAMAQTDCGACGWDCEGYANALDTGETSDITLCVPGESETEDVLRQLMTDAKKSIS